jgi:Fe-S-cluster containining protein
VTEQDIRAIAEYINEPAERFVRSYCRPSGGKLLLAQKPAGYCIFWDQNCSIHPVKPPMCKTWPFIESVLIDVENWQIMAAFCPGMKTGLSKDLIRACVKKELKRRYTYTAQV